jgi:hypothetical protein
VHPVLKLLEDLCFEFGQTKLAASRRSDYHSLRKHISLSQPFDGGQSAPHAATKHE